MTELRVFGNLPILKVIVPGVPVAKGRARAYLLNKKAVKLGAKPIIKFFNETPTENAELKIKNLALNAKNFSGLLEGAIYLKTFFYFPIPKSYSKKKVEQIKNHELWHIKKPDASNLQKLVEDALNKVIWKDDSQVIGGPPLKLYSLDNRPRTEIIVFNQFWPGNGK